LMIADVIIASAFGFSTGALLVLFIAPALEEITMRGVVWDLLSEFSPQYMCAVATAVLFALWHVAIAGGMTLVAIALLSVLLSVARMLYDVYVCIILHRLANTIALLEIVLTALPLL